MFTHHPVRASAVESQVDDLAVARRARGLAALFGIYAIGLALVAVLPDGADVGCLLAALFAHATYVATKALAAVVRDKPALAYPRRDGIFVLGERALFIRYRDIQQPIASRSGL